MGRHARKKRRVFRAARPPRVARAVGVAHPVPEDSSDALSSDLSSDDMRLGRLPDLDAEAELELFGSDSEDEPGNEPGNEPGSSSSSGITLLANLTAQQDKAIQAWQLGQQAASQASHSAGVATHQFYAAKQEQQANSAKITKAEQAAQEARANPREEVSSLILGARSHVQKNFNRDDQVKARGDIGDGIGAGDIGQVLQTPPVFGPNRYLVRFEKGGVKIRHRMDLTEAEPPGMGVGSRVRITRDHAILKNLVGTVGQIVVDHGHNKTVELPFGARLDLPKSSLESISPPSGQAEALPGGFMLGDRVRLVEGIHATRPHPHMPGLRLEVEGDSTAAVVVGADKSGNLQVRFKVSMYSNPFGPIMGSSSAGMPFQSVSPKDLCTEEAWHRRARQRHLMAQPILAEKVSIAESVKNDAEKRAKEKLEKLQALESDKKKAHDAHQKALKKAKPGELVTMVQFRNENTKPAAWRDISAYVNLVWSVRIGDPSAPPNVLLKIAEGALLARDVVNHEDDGRTNRNEHVLLAEGGPLQQLRKRRQKADTGVPVKMGAKEAHSIVRRARPRAKQPEELHSFSLLKAALGALNRVVLDPSVQGFFDSPETGIIRSKNIDVPKSLCATLRPYQRTGFQWLVNNMRNGLGCILADDMGLGKTVQTIAALLHLKEVSELTRPALVVVPAGLLATWQREVAKWAPSLKVHMYHGQGRQLLTCASPSQAAGTSAQAKKESTPLMMMITASSTRITGKQSMTSVKAEESAKAEEKAPGRQVWWKCSLPNCPAANTEIYSDDPYRAQKKAAHLRGRKHLDAARECTDAEVPKDASNVVPTVSADVPRTASSSVHEAPQETSAGAGQPSRQDVAPAADAAPAAEAAAAADAAPAGELPANANEPANPDEAAGGAQPRGGLRRRRGMCDDPADILLTSYGTLRSDVELFLQEQQFSCMVIDEAQNIKNYATLVSKAVKRMGEATGNMRVAVSGTPVENRLSDLHSQFEFVLPGYLANSRAEFERDFSRPISNSCNSKETSGEVLSAHAKEKQSLLQRMIQPFVLRRLKTDPNIAADLPDKVEQNYECVPADDQAGLYRAVQEAEFQGIVGADGQAPSQFARRGRVLAMIHALREVCNHPASLKQERRPPAFPADKYAARTSVDASGKCAVFRDILNGIIANGEKAIVFCQYLETIDILEEQVRAQFNCEPLKFVGSLDRDAREEIVKTFQNEPDRNVMLLSLQAGGVGITLTAATHVIHFDRCYNPAKENQATDRAHRIGQTKTVFVHRLVTKGTFEERLAEIMAQRQQLSDITVQAGEGWIADLNDGQLRDLFSLTGDGPPQAASAKRRRRASTTNFADA
mmetsp:Transcript_37725/g.70622  ORF Transcript_37725/g.70622 Transcript_37725/m.70622 type:complete len:1344 (-) Transcript_37725:18-4049(-)